MEDLSDHALDKDIDNSKETKRQKSGGDFTYIKGVMNLQW